MVSVVLFLLFTANLLVYSVEARTKMKKFLWLQEVKPCSFEPDQPQVNGSFRYTGQGSFYLNIDVYTPRQIDHLFFFVNLKKCPTKLISEDCEDLMTFPVGDQCDADDAYFRYIYSQFQPPISCPLSGLYQAKNVILEPEKYATFFRALGEEDWLHVSIDIYADEKKLKKKEICLGIIANMRKVRVQEKNNQKRKQ